MNNIAVVLAGGTGSRIGGAVPKQFLPLEGREVIEYSVDAFNDHEAISEVAVVVHPEWRAHFLALAERRRWGKLKAVLDGGAERHLSTLSALRHYESLTDANLLLHDAARPWIGPGVITRVAAALESHEAVAVAVPATDTLFRVADGCVAAIPPRSEMYHAQTPQAFRLPLLATAFRKALADPALAATDDCGVLLRYCPGVPIHIVAGSHENTKITYPQDLENPCKNPS